jgi:hypothetical protein
VRVKRLSILFCLSVTLQGACSTAKVGDACSADKDCTTGACLKDPFPGGYCSHDCTGSPCPDGETCHLVGPYQVCLRACIDAATDCRSGYQCHQGGCRPPCVSAEECGQGFVCTDGTCTEKPGSPLGSDCVVDDDCSSSVCSFDKKCVQGCDRDGACPSDQTCYINPVGDIRATPTTRLVPICVARRGTAALGGACTKDADCDRGSCNLGMCTEMCVTGGDCARAGTGCATLVATVDNRSGPTFKGCLPTKGMIEIDGSRGQIPFPSTGQAFAIYAFVDPFNFDLAVGITTLTDPMGMSVYTQPANEAEYYALPVRYIPSEASSTMLVPNSPRVTLGTGLYRFTAASSDTPTPSVRVFLKLGSAPPASGSAPLNIYYTDLTSSCRNWTFNQLKSGAMQSAISTVSSIFQQANLSFSGTNFIDVSASAGNSIRVASNSGSMMLPDLDNLLQAATGVPGVEPGFDVVLVRSITSETGGQSGVLGIAGGIPSNPVLGTAHSGVAVSLETLCFFGQTTFGSTIAHEIGHSVGLFHNIEQDSSVHDPLTDTAGDGDNNLMFWYEKDGENISAQQGQVMRNDPKVKQ